MISVLVAIYNVADYLPRLLTSVINQTYRDLEIILVDDGSTDGSEKICDEYSERDDRIKVIHTENGGLPSARNVGLRAVMGDYILMIDGDDALHPQMIEILYNLITSGDYDFSMCYGERIYDTSLIDGMLIEKKESFNSLELTPDSCMRDLHTKDSIWIHYAVVWNKLYKKNLLLNQFFKDTPSQDIEFNNRIYQRINRAVLLPQTLYYWIQRPSSITHQGVVLNFVNTTLSEYICLHEIPSDNHLYRAYCLEHLYRLIAIKRYRTRGTPLYKIAVSNSRFLMAKTVKEFISNSFIPFKTKCSLLLRNYLPWIYWLFLSVNNYLAYMKCAALKMKKLFTLGSHFGLIVVM